MKRGLFITFEGGEGAGKTTQIKRVLRFLKMRRRSVLTTREPGGTRLADRIRSLLLDRRNKGIHPVLELLLYCAARKDHVDHVIRPALESGSTVICDRFSDSTIAYQSFGRGLPLPVVKKLNQAATGALVPDLTIFFDLPVRQALRRTLRRRSGLKDRFERETNRFHNRVRKGYLTLVSQEKRFYRVNANGSPDRVFDQIAKRIGDIL